MNAMESIRLPKIILELIASLAITGLRKILRMEYVVRVKKISQELKKIIIFATIEKLE